MKKIYQRGITPIVIVLIILVVLVAGGLTWYFAFYQKANNNADLVTNSAANINLNNNLNANVPVDATDWQTYTNNNYHYQISYPEDWNYIDDAMSGPPAPVTAFFANTNDTGILPYASLNILVSENSDETLAMNAEIISLADDGYTKTNMTLAGENAVKLERHTLESDTGATIYVIKDNYLYRLVWGATAKATYEDNSGILSAMANSFKFITPLTADFTQTGNLDLPAESQSWYLLWDEPGNPAVNRELAFNAKDFISLCQTGNSQTKCVDALTNGLLNEGDRITVTGITNPSKLNQVFVINITKL